MQRGCEMVRWITRAFQAIAVLLALQTLVLAYAVFRLSRVTYS